MEARVCGALRAELPKRAYLLHQVRFPLLGLAPTEKGATSYLTVDFVIVSGQDWTPVDAKAKKWVSRDWRRGALAFEACYGKRIVARDR